MAFQYPSDLVEAIISSAAERYVSDDVLRNVVHLVELAFHASLLPDEARPTHFTLFVHAYGPDNAPRQFQEVVKLTQQDRLNPRKLAKLSQAVDRRRASILVTPDGHLLGIDPSGIRGLHGESLWREGPTTAPKASPIWITADGPGSIRIGSWIKELGRIANGTVYITPERDCAFWSALAPVAVALEARASDASYPRRPKPGDRLPHIVNGLLARIRDAGHGGAVLILPGSNGSGKDLRTGYVPRNDPLGASVEAYFRTFTEAAGSAHGPRLLNAERGAVEDHAGRSMESVLQAVEAAQDELERGLDFVAGLAAVDGAIVLGDSLRVLSFGTELQADAPGLETVQSFTNGEADSDPAHINTRGTRHRSMCRFCHVHPEAIGFIMSQDGGIRGVRTTHRYGVELWDPVWVKSPYLPATG